ncbi:MAG: glycosyltransferase family 4 protein [Candidatus Pacearchaeota archaeon]
MIKRRIKLAYICPWFSTEFRGPLYNLFEELSKYIDVICICARQKYVQYFKRSEKEKKKIEFINPHFKIHRFESIAPRDIIIPFDLEKILDEEKPDIIQSDEFFRLTTIIAGKWAKKNKVPLIINSRMRYRRGIMRNFALWVFKILSFEVVKYASKIIATQGIESKVEFLRWFPETKNKFVNIPNAINPEKFKGIGKKQAIEFRKKYNIPENKKIILDVARVYPVKRIDLLVKAFSLVKKEYKNVVLVIVGPSEEKEMRKIQKLIKNLNLKIGKDIFFTGPISNERIGQAYAAADIFVNTSETEGICYSFLEAMCFKLPIVAFDVGSNRYVLGKKLVFNFGDINSLARRVLEILKNKEKVVLYGGMLYNKLKKEFNINTNVKRLIEICQNEITKRKLE